MATVENEHTNSSNDQQAALVNKMIWGLVRENLGIFLSLLTILAITARIIWVAHGDAVTMTAIVAHQGVGGLVVTVFAIGLPIVAGFAAFLTAANLGESVREETPWKADTAVLIAFLLLSLLTVPSEWMLAIIVLVAALIAWALITRAVRWAHKKHGRRVPGLFEKSDGYKKKVPALMLVATLFAISPVLVFTDSMWLPKEKISFSGDKNELGYVISGDGDFTHIVREADRSSLILKTELIAQRTYCPQPAKGRPILTEWLWPTAKEYEC